MHSLFPLARAQPICNYFVIVHSLFILARPRAATMNVSGGLLHQSCVHSRQALARVHAAAWAATLLCFGVGYACAAVRAIPQPAVIAATFAAAVAAAPPPPPLSCPSANSPLRAWTSATPPRRHRPRASPGAAVAQGKSRSDPRGLQSQLRGGEQEERRAGRGAAAGPLEQPLLSWREGAAAEQDNRPAAVDVQG